MAGIKLLMIFNLLIFDLLIFEILLTKHRLLRRLFITYVISLLLWLVEPQPLLKYNVCYTALVNIPIWYSNIPVIRRLGNFLPYIENHFIHLYRHWVRFFIIFTYLSICWPFVKFVSILNWWSYNDKRQSIIFWKIFDIVAQISLKMYSHGFGWFISTLVP